jgi:hypothetical protein
MTLKKKLDDVCAEFQDVSIEKAISNISMLKKMRKEWFIRLMILSFFSCSQLMLVFFDWTSFGFTTIILSIIPFFEINRIWPFIKRINLYLYLHELIYSDCINMLESSKRNQLN